MELQREFVANSYKSLESRIKHEANDRNAKLVFDNQKEAAMEIQRLFELGMIAVTLLALTQVGKTGVMVELAYLMATHPDDKQIINYKNIFIITGMSDKDWLTQTKNNFPDAFVHIYTRSSFSKLTNLEHVRDALFIIDECHIAVEEKNQLSKALDRAKLTKAASLRERNIKLVQVSATPGYALHNARMKWDDNHGVVTLVPSNKYVGFREFLDAERIMDTHNPNINIFKEIEENIKVVYTTPKYHIFRVNRKEKIKFEKMVDENSWKCIEHNCKSREDIDDILKSPPVSHTFIIIKNFWRAGKRLQDTHIGIVYDEPAEDPNCEVIAQSLAGRLCGNDKQFPGGESPIIYCHLPSVIAYMNWYDSGGEFTSEYNSGKLSVARDGSITTKPSFHDGEFEEPIEPRSAYEISDETFDTVQQARAWVRVNLTYTCSEYKLRDSHGNLGGTTHFMYRGKARKIMNETEARANLISDGVNNGARVMPVDIGAGVAYSARIMPVDIGQGSNTSARIMPVLNPTIKYIVIYKLSKLINIVIPTF
jgi:hypothetical protein